MSALPAALHFRAEGLRRLVEKGNAAQRRDVMPDAPARQFAGRHRKKPVGRHVGAADQAIGGHCQDGDRAAVDEELELLFGFAAGIGFPLHAVQVLEFAYAAARHLVSKQPRAGQRSEHQNILRQRHGPGKGKRVECIRENGAYHGGQQNSPSRPDGAHQQEGEKVKEAEGDGRIHPPIDHRDARDEERCQSHSQRPAGENERSCDLSPWLNCRKKRLGPVQ